MPVPVPEPDPIIPTWLTPLLAIWGAFLSSVALGWNLFRDLTDRPKVKVEAKVRRIVVIPGGQWYAAAPNLEIQGASQQLFIVMSIVNVRRRPVRWQGWGGVYKVPENGKKGFVVIPRGLPKSLNEGDTHSEYTELETNGHPVNETVKRLQAWDSTGRNWKISWLRMRKLRREAREAIATNNASTA
jgi:hypothetical protein